MCLEIHKRGFLDINQMAVYYIQSPLLAPPLSALISLISVSTSSHGSDKYLSCKSPLPQPLIGFKKGAHNKKLVICRRDWWV